MLLERLKEKRGKYFSIFDALSSEEVIRDFNGLAEIAGFWRKPLQPAVGIVKAPVYFSDTTYVEIAFFKAIRFKFRERGKNVLLIGRIVAKVYT